MATIARATWSKRQLFEVMCEFWSGSPAHHLPVREGPGSARHDYDASVIRRHALGTFEDMLIASAKHPAMLVYLNNAESSKATQRERRRELLELHTVGIDGGYTEKEMFDSSLIMTGFTLNPDTLLYRYDEYAHYTGIRRVLFDRPNTKQSEGEQLGLDYLRHLARHPETARHLSRKLWIRFISDTPDPQFVDELAQVYLDNGTAITPVLRHLFLSEAFLASPGVPKAPDAAASLAPAGQAAADPRRGRRTLWPGAWSSAPWRTTTRKPSSRSSSAGQPTPSTSGTPTRSTAWGGGGVILDSPYHGVR